MNKYSPLLFVMIFSFLFGDVNVQIRLQNGQKVQGEFVGTYMNHVHILVEEKIIYYACDDITSITYSAILRFDYDCSINTVTADILFPPELDPMTGEMTQMLPDVFNPDIPKHVAKVEVGVLSTEQDFVVIDGVKYARVSPEKEVSELIKDQNYPDSLASPSHPKVNSDLKNISISHLTKEQKKKYNQNRIIIRKKNYGFDWYAYIQKGLFSSKRLNKTDFFIYTGYPDKAEIAEHNTQLYVKNYWLGGGLTYLLGIGAVNVGLEGAGMAIMFGGFGYLYYDYNEKKLEGASLNDAKIIAKKYNNDLMQRIFNEND
ncbi:MAG: hypothetical protein HN815_01505 [Candidatus Marinimicrobia bacterium]|nr:hypothetical protein [Candidatus Neomarinimicrobiota bacterium]MBT7372642.1 hypothetical protein [Candidatus Neomarinimicrobiota bacterium]